MDRSVQTRFQVRADFLLVNFSLDKHSGLIRVRLRSSFDLVVFDREYSKKGERKGNIIQFPTSV